MSNLLPLGLWPSARAGRLPCPPRGAPMMPRLILASTSAYRRELLGRLHLDFDTARPEVDEHALPGETPQALATRLASEKARAVAARFPEAWVIGSDQVADLDGQALGKPGTLEQARAQLTRMSGRTVRFQTAVSLIGPDGFAAQALDLTDVQVRPCSRRRSNATWLPNRRWSVPAASNARAWASPCSTQSVATTPPPWSACR